MRLFDPESSVQGWTQFLANRDVMLAAYDDAQVKNAGRIVKVEHGRVAEAAFREWLQEFLPARYGVTSGYVISQELEAKSPTPHFDVIIYDKLESPVLWRDNNPDSSNQGRARAIPAEYVFCVLEVKCAFTTRNAREALEHLEKLRPCMGKTRGRFSSSLPKNFTCGVIFFELRSSEKNTLGCLDAMVRSDDWLRGYFGGLVLRGPSKGNLSSGRIHLTVTAKPDRPSVLRRRRTLASDVSSSPILVRENVFCGAFIAWMEAGFAMFAFDLIDMLKQRYRIGRLSSKHGTGASR